MTFVSHQDVLKALRRKDLIFECTSSKEPKTWSFEARKIDFTCHVRNCPRADESAPIKYLPIYVQTEKMLLAAGAINTQTESPHRTVHLNPQRV